MIFPAMKTGKLNIINGAMARELLVDSAGKVSGVSYVDKATRTEKQIRCRAVVVAASACESARLLLNSKSHEVPQWARERLRAGGPQSDGHGRLRRRRRRSRRWKACRATTAMASAACTSTCRGGSSKRRTRISRAAITSKSAAASACRRSARSAVWRRAREGYGAKLKDEYSPAITAAQVSFSGRGEMIPNEHSYLRNRSQRRWISGAFRCCASTCNGARTKSTW